MFVGGVGGGGQGEQIDKGRKQGIVIKQERTQKELQLLYELKEDDLRLKSRPIQWLIQGWGTGGGGGGWCPTLLLLGSLANRPQISLTRS